MICIYEMFSYPFLCYLGHKSVILIYDKQEKRITRKQLVYHFRHLAGDEMLVYTITR